MLLFIAVVLATFLGARFLRTRNFSVFAQATVAAICCGELCAVLLLFSIVIAAFLGSSFVCASHFAVGAGALIAAILRWKFLAIFVSIVVV